MASKKNTLPDLPVKAVLEGANVSLEGIDAAGLDRINEMFMSLTAKPENFHGDDVTWQMPSMRLVQGLTDRDGINVPLDARNGDIVADGRQLFSATDGVNNAYPCVIAHCTKVHVYYPRDGEDASIRSLFPPAFDECVPASEKRYENTPGGFKTNWRAGNDYVVIPFDMSGIYKLRFIKSSGKAGRMLARKIAGWGALHQFPIAVYSKEDSSVINGQKVTYGVFDFTIGYDTEVPAEVKALAAIVGTTYDEHYRTLVAEELERERSAASIAKTLDSDVINIGGGDEDSGFDQDL